MNPSYRLLTLTIVLAVTLAGVGSAQDDLKNLDPVSLLKQISRNYLETGSSYQIEATVVEEENGDLSGRWSKSFQTAIVAPSGRYRFEVRRRGISWLQVSDGTTEWIYQPTTQEYVQRQASLDGKPGRFGQESWSFDQMQLLEAQEIPKHIAEIIGSIRHAEYVSRDMLSVGDRNLDCLVVRGQGRYMSGWSSDTTVEYKLWIESGSNVIRKIEQTMAGALIPSEPDSHYVRVTTTLYLVVKLQTASSPPTSLFTFVAPVGAKLVTAFDKDTFVPRKPISLTGNVAPSVNLISKGGHVVSLSSLRKPILIEFWATWCKPCVSAFPALEKLYSEMSNHGLTVITIDEDEEAEKAEAFLTKRGTPNWINYHDDGEINRSLPGTGLPQFVLIDKTGKITYAESGFNEDDIRAALGNLGPEFSSVAKKLKP